MRKKIDKIKIMTTDLTCGINEDTEEYTFAVWANGKPSKVNHYSIRTKKEGSIIWFRDADEITKFGKWLIANAKKNKKKERFH